MKSRFFYPIGAFCLTLIALPCGCGGAVDDSHEEPKQRTDLVEPGGEQAGGEDVGGNEGEVGELVDTPKKGEVTPVTVQLEPIGDPTWEPVDFHQFTAKWFKYELVMTSLLPGPDHAWSPLLGVAPGAPHASPYEHEIGEGMLASGLIDSSSFTSAEFTQGVYLTWMNVPRQETAPTGSSPDFDNGPILPNEIFPINVQIQYSRDGVIDSAMSVFDVPALDLVLDLLNPVDGHSHFPMWTNDTAASYKGVPAEGSYKWIVKMVDAEGEGWVIEVPYQVN